jgi:hypothetical protein
MGSEAIIENYLVKRCRSIGGVAEKFTSPNKRAVPDRLCQFPFDVIVFVELKAEGKVPTPAQAEDHKRRRARGHEVRVIDSKSGVDDFIIEVEHTLLKLKAIEDLI